MYYIVLTYVYAPRFARDGQHIITTMNVNFVRLVLCSTNIILMHASHIYVYIYIENLAIELEIKNNKFKHITNILNIN